MSFTESEIRRLERSAKREESIADICERKGRTQDALTAKINAARLRKDIEEAQEESDEPDEDQLRVGSRQWWAQSNREE